MAMVSAIQEAQKDNLRSFNDYMMKVLQVSVIHCIYGYLSDFLLSLSKLSDMFNYIGSCSYYPPPPPPGRDPYICRYSLELHFSFKSSILLGSLLMPNLWYIVFAKDYIVEPSRLGCSIVECPF